MHVVERFHQLGPVRFRERCRRQPVAQTLLSYRIERLRGKPAQKYQCYTIGARINMC